jgi:hypothetical protein
MIHHDVPITGTMLTPEMNRAAADRTIARLLRIYHQLKLCSLQIVLLGAGTGWAIEYLPALVLIAIHCIFVLYSLRIPYATLGSHPVARFWLEGIMPATAFVVIILPIAAMSLPSLQHLIPFRSPIIYSLIMRFVVRTAGIG